MIPAFVTIFSSRVFAFVLEVSVTGADPFIHQKDLGHEAGSNRERQGEPSSLAVALTGMSMKSPSSLKSMISSIFAGFRACPSVDQPAQASMLRPPDALAAKPRVDVEQCVPAPLPSGASRRLGSYMP